MAGKRKSSIILGDKELTIEDIESLIGGGGKIELSKATQKKVKKCRDYIVKQMKDPSKIIYGVNTGFGSLCNKVIRDSDLSKLQDNLVRSHAVGTGEQVRSEIIKIMLLLKAKSLSLGYSGVKPETIELLVQLYNNNVLPEVLDQGSLGASGDLAPLAHLSLPLMGEGKVLFQGKAMSAKNALKRAKLTPISFDAKEALALLNGTQFMSSYGVYLIIEAQKLIQLSNRVAALSIDAFDARLDPFDEDLHQVRAHHGQVKVAENIRAYLKGSKLISKPKAQVQDQYSFRCIPQVHGASWDTIDYVKSVLLTEINSVTDNPTVFAKDGKVISGGNFHGQPLALTLDFLAIALSELGSISERRTYLMLSGERELPAYLASSPGLESGLMILQYTAASLVSQNKQYCTPASVDSITSSNGQEDHVSMGANAATKCLKVLENLRKVVAAELVTAAQAIEYRGVSNTSRSLQEFHKAFRKRVPKMKEDRILSKDLEDATSFLSEFPGE